MPVADFAGLFEPVETTADLLRAVFPGGVHDGAGPNQFKAHLIFRYALLAFRYCAVGRLRWSVRWSTPDSYTDLSVQNML